MRGRGLGFVRRAAAAAVIAALVGSGLVPVDLGTGLFAAREAQAQSTQQTTNFTLSSASFSASELVGGPDTFRYTTEITLPAGLYFRGEGVYNDGLQTRTGGDGACIFELTDPDDGGGTAQLTDFALKKSTAPASCSFQPLTVADGGIVVGGATWSRDGTNLFKFSPAIDGVSVANLVKQAGYGHSKADLTLEFTAEALLAFKANPASAANLASFTVQLGGALLSTEAAGLLRRNTNNSGNACALHRGFNRASDNITRRWCNVPNAQTITLSQPTATLDFSGRLTTRRTLSEHVSGRVPRFAQIHFQTGPRNGGPKSTFEMVYRYTGTNITADDYPSTPNNATRGRPLYPVYNSTNNVSVAINFRPPDDDGTLEDAEELDIHFDDAKIVPVVKLGSLTQRPLIRIIDVAPATGEVKLTVLDNRATEDTVTPPAPGKFRVEVVGERTALGTSNRLEVPIIVTPVVPPGTAFGDRGQFDVGLELGVDYWLEVLRTSGVWLDGDTLVFNGSAGAPTSVDVLVHEFDDSNRGRNGNEAIEVSIPGSSSRGSPRLVVSGPGMPATFTGSGKGTITLHDDDLRRRSGQRGTIYSARLTLHDPRATYNNGTWLPNPSCNGFPGNNCSRLGEWNFVRDGQTEFWDIQVGLKLNRDSQLYGGGIFSESQLWSTPTDARGAWTTESDGGIYASDLALRGGEITRNGSKVTIGPSIELQGAPDGVTVHSVLHTDSPDSVLPQRSGTRDPRTYAIVTLRMTADARRALTTPQSFTLKVGGMLFDHCTGEYDLAGIINTGGGNLCVHGKQQFTLFPDKELFLAETHGTTAVADSTGSTDTYTVSLTRAPSHNVTITPQSSDSAAVTVSGPLVFKPSDSGDDLTKTITVTVPSTGDDDDDNPGGSQTPDVTISHTISTSDSYYTTVSVPDVTVDVVDDEPTILSLFACTGAGASKVHPDGSLYILEGDAANDSAKFCWSTGRSESQGLASGEQIVIPLEFSSDTGVDLTERNGDLRLQLPGETGRSVEREGGLRNGVTVTLTSAVKNPYGSAELEDIADASDDDTDTDVVEISIPADWTHRSAGNRNLEGGLRVDPQRRSLRVLIFDEDAPAGVFADPGSVHLDEGGSVQMQVRLTAKPGGTQHIDVGSGRETGNDHASIDDKLTFSTDTLTFTPSNWHIPQALGVTAVDDDDIWDHGDFDIVLGWRGDKSASARVPVSIDDNDPASGTIELGQSIFGTSDFTRTGGSGPYCVDLDVTLKGDYRFADAVAGGFATGTTEAHCGPLHKAGSSCRYLGTGTGALGGTAPSIALVGAPTGLSLPAFNSAGQISALRVGDTSGGTTGKLTLAFTEAARDALAAGAAVEVQIGGRLLDLEENRFGGKTKATAADYRCDGVTSLSAGADRCAPVSATLLVYPDTLSTPVDAVFVHVPELTLREDAVVTPGSPVLVGEPIVAVDFNGDPVTYSLVGGISGAFSIGDRNRNLGLADGQVTYSGGTAQLPQIDYERVKSISGIRVTAFSIGADGTPTAVPRQVTVTILPVDEGDAAVTFTGDSIGRVGTPLKVDTVAGDPDGDPAADAVSYQWQTSSDGTSWSAISGATAGTYDVLAADSGKKLRVQASYTDGGGHPEAVYSEVVDAHTADRFQALGGLTDRRATEGDPDDTATMTITLTNPLLGDEWMNAAFYLECARQGVHFNVELVDPPEGVSLVPPGNRFIRDPRRCGGQPSVGLIVRFEAPTGEASPTSATVKLTFLADDDAKGGSYAVRGWNFGTANGSFTSAQGMRAPSANDVVTVTDGDDSSKLVDFAATSATLNEGDGTANTLRVTLDISDTTSAGGVTVIVRNNQGNYGREIRYAGSPEVTTTSGRTPMDLTWAAGASTVTFDLETIPDSVDERQRTHMWLELSNPIGGFSIGDDRVMNIEVIDDDPTEVTLTGGGLVHAGADPGADAPTFVVRLGRTLKTKHGGPHETVQIPLVLTSSSGVAFGTAQDPTSGDLTWELVSALSPGVTASGLGTAAPTLTFVYGRGNTQQAVVRLTGAKADSDAAHEAVTVELGALDAGGLTNRLGELTSRPSASRASFVVLDAGVSAAALSVAPSEVQLIEGASGTYQLGLTQAPTGKVTATVTSADPAAVSLSAATQASGGPSVTRETDGTLTVVWDAPADSSDTGWAVPAVIGVGAVADADADDETVMVTHTVSGYGAVTSGPATTVTVLENSVSVAASSADEGDAVIFTVSLPVAATDDVTVPYTLADGRSDDSDPTYAVATGSADGSSADYNNSAGSVVIAKGARSAAVTVATTDDSVYESDHRFTLQLGTPTVAGGTAPPLSPDADSAVGTIVDTDDLPMLSFLRSGSSIQETDGSITVTVRKMGTTLVPVEVSWATADGGAKGGEDFTSASGTLTFAPADTDKTITVDIIDDIVPDGSEAFFIRLSDPVHATHTSVTGYVVTILATPEPKVSFTETAATVTEGSFLVVELDRSTLRDLSNPFDVPIQIKSAGGSAGAGDARFLGATTFELRQSPGTLKLGVTASRLELRLAAVLDAIAEGSETLTLEFGDLPEGVFLGTNTELVVTIVDRAPADDLPADHPLVPAGVGAGESFRLLFSTRGIDDAGLRAIAATSSDIDDYNDAVIAATSARAEHSVPPLAAPYASMFRAVASTAAVTAQSNTGTASTDADTPIYWLGGNKVADDYDDFYDGDWDDEAAPTNVYGNRVIGVFLDDGTHWTGIGFGSGSSAGHPLGSTGAQASQVAYGRLNDSTAGVGPLTGRRGGTTAKRPLYGLSPVFTVEPGVSIADATAAEGGTLVFTITLPEIPANPVTVPFTVTDGRGVGSDPAGAVATGSPGGSDPDSDYSSTGRGSVGITGVSTATIHVRTIQDSVYEGDHYFTVTLGQPTVASGDPPVLTANAASAVGTITDAADVPTVSFSATAVAADEDDGTVTLTVTSSDDRAVDVGIDYATVAGTATEGADYTGADASVTLPHDASTASFTVTLLDDDDDEPPETFEVTLASTGNATAGTDDTATVTISDDDPTRVSLSGGGFINEMELSKTVTVTVTLGRELVADESIAVPLVLAGAGIAAGDFTLTEATGDGVNTGVTLGAAGTLAPTVTFAGAGARVATLIVTPVADDNAEVFETMEMTLGTLPAGTVDDGDTDSDGTIDSDESESSVKVTLTDEPGTPVTITLGDGSALEPFFTVDEGGAGVVLRASLSSGTGPVSVTVTATGLTPGAGASDHSFPASIEIPAGATEATATFGTVPDSLLEDQELFVVAFSAPPGFVVSPAGTSFLVRDSGITVDIQRGRSSIREDASRTLAERSVELTVNLRRALRAGERVDVPLAISGTGVTAGDFTLTVKSGEGVNTGVSLEDARTLSPTVMFDGAGAMTAVLVLTAVDDDVAEVLETVTVELGSLAAFAADDDTVLVPPGPVGPVLAFSSVEVGIIDDDPVPVALGGGGAVTETDVSVTAEVTVKLGRALAAGESFVVPLVIAGVATDDFTLAAATGAGVNTGVTLADEGTLAPTVTFSGAGAQTATLVVSAVADDVEEDPATMTVTLGTLPSGTVDAGDTDRDGSIGTVETATSAEVRFSDGVPVVIRTSDGELLGSTLVVSEGETVDLTATLGTETGPLLVSYTVELRDGASAADYRFPASIHIPAGESAVAFTFEAVLDAVSDPSEVVRVSFSVLEVRDLRPEQVGQPVEVDDEMVDPRYVVSPAVVDFVIHEAADAVFAAAPTDLALAENADRRGNALALGSPVSASDANGDAISYSLVSAVTGSGRPTAGFIIDESSGQVSYGGRGVDFESSGGSVVLTVAATSLGADRTPTAVTQQVTVSVTNVDEGPGVVSVSGAAQAGRGTLRAVGVSGDPDGDPTGSVSWQWQRSADVSPRVWSAISGATGASYAVAGSDAGMVLRVRASYSDGGGFSTTAFSQEFLVAGVGGLTAVARVVDAVATEGSSSDTAVVSVRLDAALRSGESVSVPLLLGGESAPSSQWSLRLAAFPPTGVTLSAAGAVTFTGPTSATATVLVGASADSDTTSERLVLSVGSVTGTGPALVDAQFSGSVAGDATVWLAEPGPRPVDVSVSTLQVPEGASVVVTAALRGPPLAVDVRVPLAVTGTGVTADDYALTPSSVLIEAGETEAIAMLSVLADDEVEEDPESWTVGVGSPLPAAVSAGTSASLSVSDSLVPEVPEPDPPPPGTLRVLVTAPDAVASEGTADKARLRVRLSRPLVADESMSVPLTFTGGSEGTSAGDDFRVDLRPAEGVTYNRATRTVTFTGPSPQDALLDVTAHGDADAVSETVTVGVGPLSGVAPEARWLRVSNAVFRIVDSDQPRVMLADVAGVLNLSEPDGTAAYRVRLSSQPTQSVTVTPTVAPGAAVSVTGPLTFAPADWNMWQTVTVTVVDDAVDAVDAAAARRVVVSHAVTSDDDDYDGIVVRSVQVTVADDDPTVVSLSRSDSGTITEGAAAAADREAVFTVELSRALAAGETIQVPLLFSGTGVTGSDFSLALDTAGSDTGTSLTRPGPLSATATFTGAGAQTATLVLTAAEDSLDEAAETLAAALGSAAQFKLLGLTNTAGGAAPHASANRVSVAVADGDDPLTVSLSSPDGASVTVAEGDVSSTVSLEVTLSRALVAGQRLVVPLQLAGGTFADDLTAVLSGTPDGVTLNPAAGVVTFTGPSAAAATVTVSAADDADTASESITVTVPATASGYTASGLAATLTGTGTVTVGTVDDDAGFVVSGIPLEVTEGASGSYTVRLARRPAGPVSVALTAPAGVTATVVAVNDEGRTVTDPTLLFDTANWSTPQTVTVSVADDDVDSAPRTAAVSHTVTARVAADAHLALGDVTVAIADDDPTPVRIGLAGSADRFVRVLETGGAATVEVTLGEAGSVRRLAAGEVIDVPLAVGGTATLGNDYTIALSNAASHNQGVSVVSGSPLTGTAPVLRFAAHAAGGTATLVVSVTGDSTDEDADETITVALGTQAAADSQAGTDIGGGVSMGTEPDPASPGSDRPQRVTVAVADDDAADAVIVDAPDGGIAVVEGDAATAGSYTLRLAAAPTGTVTVTATAAAPLRVHLAGDSPAPTAAATFTAADWWQPQTVTVTAVDADAADSADPATVRVTHGVSGYGSVAAADPVDVAVHDNTATVVSVTGGGTVRENDSRWTAEVQIQLARPLAAGETVDVPIRLTTSTGAPLSDIARRSSLVWTVTGRGVSRAQDPHSPQRTTPFATGFTVRLSGAGAQTATVTFAGTRVDNDSSDETVTVAFNDGAANHPSRRTNVTGGIAKHATQDSARITVSDANSPPLSPTASFAAAEYTASEAAGSRTATVTVTLTPAPGSSTDVSYTVSGTATQDDEDGDDYQALTGTVTVGTDGTGTIDVTVIDDTDSEPPETVVLTLTDGTGYDPDPAADTTTVTIADDDDPLVTITHADGTALGPTVSVDEGGAGVVLRASLSSGTGPVSVTVSVSALSPGAALSDVSFPASIEIAAGATEGTATFGTVPDSVLEDNELFNVGFSVPSGFVVSPAGVAFIVQDSGIAVDLIGSDSRVREDASRSTRERSVELTVQLRRVLAAGERVDAPLAISGAGVTADDFTLSLASGEGVNTGVSLEGAATLSPTVIFAGAGAGPRGWC